MRWWTCFALAALGLAGCGTQGSPIGLLGLQDGASTGQVSPTGRYLVTFRPAVPLATQNAALQAAGDQVVRDIGQLGVRVVISSESGAGLDASLVDYVEPDGLYAAPPLLDGQGQAIAPRSGWSVADVGSASRMASSLGGTGDAGHPVNDPLFSEQWGLEAIHAPQAWERTMGDPSVVVAVIDTGVDLMHPDLEGQLVPGISFVDEVQGPSGQPGDTRIVPVPNKGPIDDNGHGTHVSGIIAAAADNGIGVAGVAPLCKVMPVKVLAYNTKGMAGDVASGIVWAVDHGARILNMSLGGDAGSQTLAKAVAYAEAHGALVIAAMGNDGDNLVLHDGADPNYPASLPGVVAVGATTQGGNVASFSNHGRWISVAAPGEGILSTTPTYPVYESMQPGYDMLSGTSMATPFVSGVAALLWSEHPSLTADQIREILCHTATPMLFAGFNESTGWGQIDAAAGVDSPF